MKERITEFVKEQAYRPLTADELAEALNVPPLARERFDRALAELEIQGLVIQTRAERYGTPERMNLYVGRVQGHPRGFGFLIPDNPGTDVFLGKESLGGAMHGDRVVVRLTATSREGRPEGEVIRILTRAHQRVVGNYEQSKWGGYVKPDDRRIPEDILVPKGATAGARPGEKVVLLIARYPDGRKPAEGRIVERLGRADDPDVEIQAIVRKHDLAEAFSPKAQREAESIEIEILPEELAGRRDLRGDVIVTIDGEDAKDLDDAIQVRRLPNGNWELGVHIADVSHYVRESSALDREAYSRGTSVYFPDRVIPMLPQRLSNGICSLHPYEDRLTLSCTMEINDAGRVVRHDIYPSVIRSVERLNYTEVSNLLDNLPGSVTAKLAPLESMLRESARLAEILRQKRSERGALDFDLPEAKLIMGEEGVPSDIYRAERRVANRLIEEFMLAANETVAEHVARMEIPFVYRVHENPTGDRLETLGEFLALFGYRLRLPKNGVHPKQLQEVTRWAQGRPEEGLINTVLLRSMKQAKYLPTNEGHFGLGAEYYCHFTSPIRRYPDLIVHRVLREIFNGRIIPKRRQRLEIVTAESALQSSERERAAVEAEREVHDLLKCRFMLDKVGDEFDGIISSVTPFGFFVQLPSTVEGLVHISTLDDDYYHYEERVLALVGERTRRRYRLGDAVRVQLVRVDTAARQIDFNLLGLISQPLSTGFPEEAPHERQGRPELVRGGTGRLERPVREERPAAVERPVSVERPAREERPSRNAGRPLPTVAPVDEEQETEEELTVGRSRRRRRTRRGKGKGAEVRTEVTVVAESSKTQAVRPGRNDKSGRREAPIREELAVRDERLTQEIREERLPERKGRLERVVREERHERVIREPQVVREVPDRIIREEHSERLIPRGPRITEQEIAREPQRQERSNQPLREPAINRRNVEVEGRTSGGNEASRDMWGVPMKVRATTRPISAEMRREETGSGQAPWSLPASADRGRGGGRAPREPRANRSDAPLALPTAVLRSGAEGAADANRSRRPGGGERRFGNRRRPRTEGSPNAGQ